MIAVLQIAKRYTGSSPLNNAMFQLNPKKFRVHVCYLKGHPDNRNPLDHHVYKTHYLECESNQLAILNLSLLFRLKSLIEFEKIDIINCHLPRTLAVCLAASLIAKRGPLVISTIHGLGSCTTYRRKIKNWIMYRYIHKIITVSEAARQDVLNSNLSIDPHKVVTIQNGLDLENFTTPFDKDIHRKQLFPDINASFWYGTLGRLSEVKNHERLIRSFAKVIKKHPDCVLLIAGQGHLAEKLKKTAQDNGVDRQVKFLGFRSDVPDVLHCLDLFVFPSLREGLPLSMIEAMATGLPIVAADVGGIPEVFSTEEMGILVNPLDEAQLTEAMLKIIELSPNEREMLGVKSQKRALDHFQSHRMMAEYEVFYDNICREYIN